MERSERIEAGMCLLDSFEPGWEAKIDLTKLNIASHCDCVLGQLYGTYSVGLGRTGLESNPMLTGWNHGFTVGSDGNDVITEAWREAIASRRAVRLKEHVAVG